MLTELETFIAVVEVKNFTRAAELLSLSQPSVSMHIKHLEQEFGTTLIQRGIKKKSITITPAGEILYASAKQIQRLIENTKIDLSSYANDLNGTLHIGASFTIGEYFLPAILGEFSRLYPKLKLQVSIENTVNICNKLEQLQIDIGLVEGEPPPELFDTKIFYEDKLVLITAPDHPLSGQPFNPANWQNLIWITREIGSGSRQQLDDFLAENKITADNLTLFSSNFAVKEAVKNNLGVALISEYIAQDAKKKKEISLVPMHKKYFRNFQYLLPKGIKPNRSVQSLVEHLQKI